MSETGTGNISTTSLNMSDTSCSQDGNPRVGVKSTKGFISNKSKGKKVDVCDESDDQSSLSGSPHSERDEVKEIKKKASKDTRSVNASRLVFTAALLITACGVIAVTYKLLKDEEKNNFETAFDQFSGTLRDAAIGQQSNLRGELDQLGTQLSVWSSSNQTTDSYPFATFPNFETVASMTRKRARIETLSVCPLVLNAQQEAWGEYADLHKGYVYESHMTQTGNLSRLVGGEETFSKEIQLFSPQGMIPDVKTRDYYLPIWQYSPPIATYGALNANIAPIDPVLIESLFMLQNETLFTRIMKHPGVPLAFTQEEHALYHSKLVDSSVANPHAFALHPVHASPGDKTSPTVAVIAAPSAWDVSLMNLLPEGVEGIHTVIKNTCNESFTYEIVGGDALYRGFEDLHEAEYDDKEVVVNLALHSHPGFVGAPGHCQYSMHIYPSAAFQATYSTNMPEIFAGVMAVTFVCVAAAFIVYDMMQQRRNENLVNQAAQSNSIVTDLFPENMRDRLLEGKGNLKTFLNDEGKDVDVSQPIADLYLDATILFADISGFTAWSSVREPSQVFILLETLFQAFDVIAKRRRIFKVETVGDCYVAVCGVPDPRKDHAVAICKFASDILRNMNTLTKDLERKLGPDTNDLKLRVGVHSGPVTAGVIRGERSRFQLFGDTVNTCSRIESTGKANSIHCSKATATLLEGANREAWLQKRADPVFLKGIGTVESFWVQIGKDDLTVPPANDDLEQPMVSPSSSSQTNSRLPGLDGKAYRLIDWNVETLLSILKKVVARRQSEKGMPQRSTSTVEALGGQSTPLDEVKEIIHLPEYNAGAGAKKIVDPDSIEIPKIVAEQLHNLVSVIATVYNGNAFHNFEHASHVVMSVIKLMNRIVSPSMTDEVTWSRGSDEYMDKHLHDHTYGIANDPLTQFACAFSALIHDADHVGVSNAQLVSENVSIAAQYKNRSVAEQNSLDLSWELLMKPEYSELRSFAFATDDELAHFRQLVVNSVMATDIADKDQKNFRNARWEKAFSGEAPQTEQEIHDAVNRKATIVIEHIIQASDISHTMQHWHVYKKWNRRLFEELYVAYLNGRMEKNPADFWYQGEFGFFDFYIIPITQKLKECQVFGVSSGEFFDFATKNRAEWERQGESVVAEVLRECESKYGTKDNVKISRHWMPRTTSSYHKMLHTNASEKSEKGSTTQYFDC